MNLRRSCLAIASLAMFVASSAGAQTSLGQNKTGAQLYASVCVDCHKSPQALKPTGIFGFESFLREHYTADRQSAAAIAAYLNGLKKPVAEPSRGRTAKRKNQAQPFEPSKSTNEPRPPADIPRPPADLKLRKLD